MKYPSVKGANPSGAKGSLKVTKTRLAGLCDVSSRLFCKGWLCSNEEILSRASVRKPYISACLPFYL